MPITKRHKSILLSGIAAAIGVSLLTACASDPISVPKSETYTRDFIKTFGTFDRSHDWNHATKASVNVTTASATDIKIYATVDNVRYLFATYLGVDGQRTLNVDVPKGTTDLIINANGVNYEVKAGGSVNLTERQGRLITDAGSTPDNKLTWRTSRERMLLNEAVAKFKETYKEGENNLGEGTTSFYFVADGNEHTFYPLYWNTSARHVLGIYYIPDNNYPDKIVMQDLYHSKSGELLLSNHGSDPVATGWNPQIDNYKYKAGEVRMFGTNKLTPSELREIYPGFKTTYEKYADSNESILTWTNDSYQVILGWGADIFGTKVNDYTWIYDESNALFKTDHGYISRLQVYWNHQNGHRIVMTETVTKDYDEALSYNRNGFVPSINVGNKEPATGEQGYDMVCTRGITYRLDENTKYGFYIKINEGGNENAFIDPETKEAKSLEKQDYDYIIFSQASRNKSYEDTKMTKDEYGNTVDVNKIIRDHPWSNTNFWNENLKETDAYAYASWSTVNVGGKDYGMFAFEDWKAKNNSEGPDLNDLMFIFETGTNPSNVQDESKPETPTPTPDPKPFTWIIACEDLGTNDFDFNDVVFGISNPVVTETDGGVTTTTVDITPLASGGTLPVYLYYDGELIAPEGTNNGEFHSWFGKYPSNNPINVRSFTPSNLVHTLKVKNGFTMECCQTVQGGETGNMGGFQVHVEYPSGTEVIGATNPNAANPDLNQEIGSAPQMICVPSTWLWPVENKLITLVYYKFTDWCADKNTHNEWHKNPMGSAGSHYVHRDVTATTPARGK